MSEPKNLLHIAPDLDLPLSVVTEKLAILARSGAGKTYTGCVLAEEMLKARAHVVILDPMGVWFGLRAGRDGEAGGGLPILILGGDHGDLPLDPSAVSGFAVAEMVVEQRLSCILDLARTDRLEMLAFVAAFLVRLYQINKRPLHLIIDEANLFAPQQQGPGQDETLRAMIDIMTRGRYRGIGVTVISQRAAGVSKDVLSQVEVLIAQRTTGSLDRKAIDTWIASQGTDEERKEVMGSLATLAVGEAWIHAPNLIGPVRRVQIRERETFDASSTPEVGADLTEPRALSTIDLGALRERFAGAIDKAESEDPAKLREKLADLERRLQELTASRPAPEQVIERVEIPVFTADALESLHAFDESIKTFSAGVANANRILSEAMAKFRQGKDAPAPPDKPDKPATPAVKEPESVRPATKPAATAKQAGEGLSAPQQRILDALAEFDAMGVKMPARSNIASWSGASPKSSSYQNNLSTLKTRGLIEYPNGVTVRLTPGGLAAAKPARAAASHQELRERWKRQLSGPQGLILDYLCDRYGQGPFRSDVAAAVGASATSSSFSNNLSVLKTFGLVKYPDAQTVAATVCCSRLQCHNMSSKRGKHDGEHRNNGRADRRPAARAVRHDARRRPA